MSLNIDSNYGRAQAGRMPQGTTGKILFVVGTSGVSYQDMIALYRTDPDGLKRVYTTMTLALAACVADRGDMIITAPDFTTAVTAAELLIAETKGVKISQAGISVDGVYSVDRAAATLPATTATAYFTVTGRIKLIAIIGEVTTVVETQACNTKLVANPTVGADVDLCAVLSITAAAVGTQFSITGTLANAMVKTASGAGVFQAAPLLIQAGTIDLNTAATNTGATKWKIIYTPVDPGARIFVA